jgi:hypothetical protein
MPKRRTKLQIVHRRDPPVQCVNEKIARLTAVKPWGDVYAAFALAAHLATEAIEVATELRQMPGASARTLQPTLDFWYHVRELNRAAALSCSGENQTLVDALVTFRFLQMSAEKSTDKNKGKRSVDYV